MARIISSAAAPVRRSVSDERNIFAYCNIRTNQVLYSLTPRLKPAHLKQLPDIGANYTPPTLRKDMWRPLWRVDFPESPHRSQQVLHAFKKLREWRKMHELCWEPTREMSRPFTEVQIEKLQEQLDQRGGSKKETVYDLIKRQKRKMRVRIIMDQKANSVADLAAVLIEQHTLGEQSPPIEFPTSLRLTDAPKILELARRHDNPTELAAVNEQIAQRQENVKLLEGQLIQGLERPKTRTRMMIEKAKKLLKSAELASRKMEWSAQAVAKAREEAEREGERDMSDQSLAKYLPKYFPEQPHALRMGLNSARRDLAEAPQRGWVAADIKRRLQPRFDAEGIQVSWFNVLDRNFARKWPEPVSHHEISDRANHSFSSPKPEKREPSLEETHGIDPRRPKKLATEMRNLSIKYIRRKARKENWLGQTKEEYWKSKEQVMDLERTPSRFARQFRDKFHRQRVQVAAGVSQ